MWSVFLWKTIHVFCGRTFLWYEVLLLPLIQLFSNIWERAFGRFQLEAPGAYKCKQILGLFCSSLQMENQCGLWKKLCEVQKMNPAHRWVSWWIIMNQVKHKCFVGEGDNWVQIPFMTVESGCQKRCDSPNIQSFWLCSATLIVPFVWTDVIVQASHSYRLSDLRRISSILRRTLSPILKSQSWCEQFSHSV